MDHDPVGEAIRLAFDEASEPVTLEEVVATRRESGRRLRAPLAGWAVAVAASLMVIGGIAVTVRVAGPTEPPLIAQPAVPSTSAVQPSLSPTTEESIAPSPTIASLEPTVIESIGLEGWSAVEIPKEYARCGGVQVWTGSEIVLWGGPECKEDPADVSGVAYDPETKAWRVLPEAPIRPQVSAGIWNGSELIVCCGEGSSEGAAYDPEANTWRSIARSPLQPLEVGMEAVWTGTEMLVVGQTGVAAYEPRTDTWRRFENPPEPYTRPTRSNRVVWTGSVAVIWPANVTRSRFLGLALDPASGEWEVLPAPPAWPAAPGLVWTGAEILVWGGLPAASVGSERAVGSRFDLATRNWTPMSEALPEPQGCECNLGSQTLIWTGEELVVSTGRFGTGANVTNPLLLSYRPDTDRWAFVGELPGYGLGSEGLIAGNRVVLFSDRLYVSDPGWVARGEPIDGLLQPYQDTYENPQRGFRLTHPSNWYRETEDLTPRAGQSMLVAVGTGAGLIPGGPRCSHMPVRAMEDMGTTDVFIQLEDWGVASTDAAPRPASFGSLLSGIDTGDAWNCLAPAAQAEIGVLRWFPFQDQGRSFLLLVVIGTEASAEDRAKAEAILDSFEFEPG